MALRHIEELKVTCEFYSYILTLSLTSQLKKKSSMLKKQRKKRFAWKKSWFSSQRLKKATTLPMAQKAINDVRAFLGKLKVNRILIYPFAHLSSNLSKPSEALKIIKAMEAYAKAKRHRNLPCTVWLEQTIHHLNQRSPA